MTGDRIDALLRLAERQGQQIDVLVASNERLLALVEDALRPAGLLTAAEMARALGVDRRTVYRARTS